MKVYGNFNMSGGAEIIEIVVDSGTSDPGSPVPGELYYRSDLQELRFYNGTTWTSTGSGAPGTVTSVALADGSSTPIYTVTGSPVTVAGTLTLTLGTQTANHIFAGPTSGGVTQPTFRTLVTADLPAGTGTVTSVAATGSTGLTVGGSPITTSGTLTFTLGTELQGLSALSANGYIQRTGTGTYSTSTSLNAPGSNHQVVYNNSGVLGANTGLTYDGSTILTVGTFTAGGGIVKPADSASGGVSLTVQGSNPTAAAGNGGGVSIVGTNAFPASNGNGGDVTISSGSKDGTGTNGAITISSTGDASFAGNTVEITGSAGFGQSVVISESLGSEFVLNYVGCSAQARDSNTSFTGTSATDNAGVIALYAGAIKNSTTTNVAGGYVSLYAGNSTVSGQQAGLINLYAGGAQAVGGLGGDVNIMSGQNLAGGAGGNSGSVNIKGMNALGTGNNNGGNVVIQSGTKTGSGTAGFVEVIAPGGLSLNGSLGTAGQVLTSQAGAQPTWTSATSGTVTSVSVVTANGVSGSVATATSTPAITLTLGAITPSSVAASGTVTGSNLSGTNTGDQTITLTGDVTGTGTSSFAATLATVNSNVGSFGDASHTTSVTVNGKGLVTAASQNTIALAGSAITSGTVSGARLPAFTHSGDATGTFDQTNPGNVPLTLATVNSSVGSFGDASHSSSFTVNGKGLVTAASQTAIAITSGAVSGLAASATTDTTNASNISSGTLPSGRLTGVYSGVTGLGSQSQALNMNSNLINNVSTPVSNGDAANKAYVDALGSGITWKQSVKASTTANLSGTYVGTPTFTLTNNGTQAVFAVDGYSASVNDRILVKNQTTQSQNGIYQVTTVGSGSTNWVLTRTSDFNEVTPIDEVNGAAVYVQQGTLYSNTGWTQIDVVTTFDTSNIAWAQFSGAGSGVSSLTAGTGINVSSPTGAVTISNTGVTSAIGTANQVIVSGATGAVTFSLPQSINSGAAPTFAGTNFTSIPNGALTNSSITIGSTSVSLGATATTLAGLTSVTSTTFVGALTGNASTATSATTATNVTGGTTGSLVYQTGAGATGFIADVATGQVLTSGGVGVVPAWSSTPTFVGTNISGTAAALNIGGTANEAGNLNGGAAGSLPYQTAAGATSYVAAGTSSQVLVSGTTPAWTNTPTLTGTNFSGTAAALNIGGNAATATTATSATSATSATTATNIAAGTTNQIPYQTGAGATVFFSASNYGVHVYGSTGVPQSIAGAAGVLQGSAAAIPAFTTTPTLTGTNFTGIPNGALTNSSVTIGSTSVSLGATVTTFTGLTSVTSTTFVGALTGNASTATSATTATNLAGGANGSLPYQTGSGTTTFLTAGTNGFVLTLAGGVPTWANPASTSVSSITGTANQITASASVGAVTLSLPTTLTIGTAATGPTINATTGTTNGKTFAITGSSPGTTSGNSGDMNISIPQAGTTGAGGTMTLQGGAGGSTSGNAGGVTINGGSSVSGTGGNIQLSAGAGTTAGFINFFVGAQNAMEIAPLGQIQMFQPAAGGTTLVVTGNSVINAQDNVTNVSAAGVTTTIDCTAQNVEKITLGAGANTITFSNTPGSNTSQTMTILLLQDATGSRVLPTFSQTINWDNGLTPVLTTTASKLDILQIMIVNIAGTTKYYGAQVMGNVTP